MVRGLIRCGAAALALGALLAGTAAAQVIKGSEARALAEQAAARLAGIETLAAHFDLMTPGGINKGEIFLDRRREAIRMEFAEPLDHLVLVNGPLIQFYGGDGTELQMATAETPLAFLMDPEKALRENVEVLQVEKRGGDLYVAVTERNNKEKGQVVLRFAGEGGWRLTEWGTFTDDGGFTQTMLREIETGADLDADLFRAPE
ncbi:MAG TPA: outer-membrane lipoprotein carrier protein LolA [Alphaproteobacteria bacterium]|nr:outer-membrane lipoprotein carrier protein LolA [Alphaproteobacteria bacterium]